MIAVVSTQTALVLPAHAHPRIEGLAGGLEILEKLEPEWRSLCEHGEYDQPFYRPELIRAYLEAFAPGARLFVLTARVGTQLVAILPLIHESGFIAGIPVRKLRTPGNVHTCRYDLVHVSQLRDAIVSAMWGALKTESHWDVLELSSVPAGSALTKLVQAARADNFPAHAVRAVTSPYLPLTAGEGFERVLDRVDGKFRANLRRRMRKLQTKGNVQLVCTSAVDDQLQRFYELERAGWKGTEGSAIAQDTRTSLFYQALAREAERFGYLSLYSLHCEGQPVAMHYGLTHRGRYYILKTAYDQRLAECSPGQLLTMEVLRDLARLQCVELDFLGLSMDWKRDWAPRLRSHADWSIFRGSRGALVHFVHARTRRALGRTIRRWKARGTHQPVAGSIGLA